MALGQTVAELGETAAELGETVVELGETVLELLKQRKSGGLAAQRLN